MQSSFGRGFFHLAAMRRRRLQALLVLCLVVPICQVSAQQPLPDAPGVTAAGVVTGTVLDRDGDAVEGAQITLTRDGEPSGKGMTAVSNSDGTYSFSGVQSGAFHLSISAAGFEAQQTSGEVPSGEGVQLPSITLLAGSATNIQVTASQTDIAEAQINEEEKQRVLGVFPNFYVSYIPNPVPLDPRQKFELAFRTLIDPISLVLNGVTAGVQQATNTYSWGQGAQGYGKRYAAAYGTFMNGTILGNAILPILLKQDPRYFYKGTGSTRSRIGYAIANSVICKGDNHRWQPNYSAILGGVAAGAISNFYYPADNRSGAALTFESAAIGTGFSAITNLLQEFLIHKLTRNIPPPAPAADRTP